MSTWGTDDDFTRDIQEISVFSHVPDVRGPITSLKRYVRKVPMKSIYDEDEDVRVHDDCEDDVEYCKPVRGRPIHQNYKRPGGSPTFMQNQTETSASIRMVSGLGYSNELIEHMLKSDRPKNSNDNNNNKPLPMPNIRFNNSDSRSSSSTTSNSPVRSPITTKGIVNDPVKSQTTADQFSSILKNVNNKNSESPPPPLFDIIRNKSNKSHAQNRNCIKQDQIRTVPETMDLHMTLVESGTKTNTDRVTNLEEEKCRKRDSLLLSSSSGKSTSSNKKKDRIAHPSLVDFKVRRQASTAPALESVPPEHYLFKNESKVVNVDSFEEFPPLG